MRFRALLAATASLPLSLAAPTMAQAGSPFTLQQVLSAPYATQLTAAPVGNNFAWVEDSEGRHNLWVGAPGKPARQLTHNTADDGLDLTDLTWSPDASAIAYTYGTETGADGKPSNPAHLQHPVDAQVIVQPVEPAAQGIRIGAGHAPLFDPLNHQVVFIRAGQIWTAQLGTACISEGSGCDLDVSPSDTHQLVIDRGNASSLTLSPDGKTLAFISTRREANEPAHKFLALFDLTTHTLTFPDPSTANDSAPTWSPDGQHLAWLRSPFTQAPEFAPDRTSPNPWSIQLMDLTRPITTGGFEGAGLQPRRNAAPGEVGALAPEGNPRTIFTPTPNQPGSVLPHMATGEPRLFWTADNRLIFPSEADGYVHLYALDPTTSTSPTLLTPGAGEIEDVSLSADRKEAFWSSNIPMNMVAYAGLSDCIGTSFGLQAADIERRHISSVDLTKPSVPRQQANKPNAFETLWLADSTKRTTGEGIETRPTPLADGSLVALASDSFVPMHPVFVAKDGSLTDVRKAWLPSTYPQAALVFPEEVSFRASDGQMLHAQIFLPGNMKAGGKDPLPWCNGHKAGPPAKVPERRPAILFLHGGPRRQMLLGYPAMGYYSNAYAMNQYLASRGFIVLSVNYRCGIGYGLDFRQCLHAGADGATEYNDVLAAQRYLASRTDVDPKRIGLWGGSYGGYLTALALARNSNLFAAGVDFHGVHDWNLEDNASDWLLGDNAERDAIAAKALASSPIGSVAKWTSPVLLIHGDNDNNVAYAQTPILADKLRAQGTPVEELIFPDEVHEFELHSDWLKAYAAAAAFFEKLLKP
jgi:dipeptidyl aminopeptidase/acylaminoacyl peptidase